MEPLRAKPTEANLSTHLLSSTYTEDKASRESETILPITLQVGKLCVVVVGLDGSYPNVFRDTEVNAAADDHGEGGVGTCGKAADFCREESIEGVSATE